MIKSSMEKADQLEAEAKKIRQEEFDKERKQKEAKQAALEKKTKISTYRASDYAGLDIGDLNFYYGYEQRLCSKHGVNPNCEDDHDCYKAEDCFVVTKGKKEIMRIPDSQLAVEVYDVAHGLICGIGHYIRRNL